MKILNNISEIALLCIAVHYQEGIKFYVNKCGLSLTSSSVEKIYVFNTGTSPIFP